MSRNLPNPKTRRRAAGWKLPSDPTKPELPYRRGTSLSIRAHIPPPPFGFGYLKEAAPRRIAHWTDLDGMTQTEWCSQHPIIDTPPHPDKTIRHLHLLEEVACRDGRGAQVLKCSMDGSDDNTKYIAKIYDPLYYAYVGSGDDATWKADQDYGSEAAAYEEFKRAGVDGSLAPKYYGSWTFDMVHPETPKATRSGARHRMSPQHRLDILAKAMEVFSKMEFYGVRQLDFAPRNVLLIGSHVETSVPRVMIFDFGISAVFSQPTCTEVEFKSKLPISPRYLFWANFPGGFYEWLPHSHRLWRQILLGWMKSHWENTTEFGGPPALLDSEIAKVRTRIWFATPTDDERWTP
ncbi:hypothetical protein HOO65_011208 [Ceratocystis lukuohia]|uniref:Protein kinase domain-containing protein n=1 Tax=Ceratocystis lukuohia TaxID=2019550 RepID=A0ABR4MUA0_9PEZI